jgi:hypothetical protein
MAQLNTNLRVLSLAYSNGKLTKDQYTALRSKQLSAIEFGKPFPPMPPGLSNVNIPSVKIEAPSEGGGAKKKAPILAIAAILGLLLLGIAIFIAAMSGEDEPSTQGSIDNSISGQAQRLINAGNNSVQDIQLFTASWKALGEQQQKLHRKATWFAPLQTEANNTIKDLNAAKDLGQTSTEGEVQLKSWKILNRLLSPASANIQPQTISATPQPSISTTEQESLLGEALSPVTAPTPAPVAAPAVAPAPTPAPVAAPALAPPVSTRSGVDLNPEYEREQEFGKSARDALFGDTPEY